jgi:hypothetical protein
LGEGDLAEPREHLGGDEQDRQRGAGIVGRTTGITTTFQLCHFDRAVAPADGPKDKGWNTTGVSGKDLEHSINT